MWTITYSDEAANYLYGNWPYLTVVRVFLAIETLYPTETGLPPEDTYVQDANRIYWRVEDHLVIINRNDAEKLLHVEVIKPN